MPSIHRRAFAFGGALGSVAGTRVWAQAGTDAKPPIKIGQTEAYSGPASLYATFGRIQIAYIKMINAKGGVNGRKIDLISLDDGYNPPKTVEQTRRLVEQDEVLAMVGSAGTAPQLAVQKYLNGKGVPQLLIPPGTSRFNNPREFPWTLALTLPFQSEAKAYARYILENKPDAKVGILYQNDDLGKDYVAGLRTGLGDKAASMLVKEVPYDLTAPTIESQMLQLKNSGATALISASTPKFAAQAIRDAASIGWKPLHFVSSVSSIIDQVFRPAGIENAVGVITAQAQKNPADPKWKDDPGVQYYLGFLKDFYPEALPGGISDPSNLNGFSTMETFVKLLERCGNDVTRENLMKQATSMKDLKLSLLLPGIEVNTTPTDYSTYRKFQLARFDGETWVNLGPLIDVASI